MKQEETGSQIEWPYIYYSKKYEDARGSFQTLYSNSIFEGLKLNIPPFVQNNVIIGTNNSIRGFHALRHDWKVLSCVQGEILEVFVDLRPESTEYGRSNSINLNEQDEKIIVIPPGIGHAFQVLSSSAILVYSTTIQHLDSKEIDVNPLSKDFAQYWQEPFSISVRDEKAPFLEEFLK